ncbi:hypothetical protein EUGRSUZ_J03018 [Eucalyptus grandis]|uniref:Uncharacterized protein n=2 Tax=Eucalyptus grandis TaxID=71139 RepID=A0ACC3JBU4_EUCGR|nr:hypothetical protein EUGRSUZ_J03018 [Eucalyptus grandis]
MSDLLLFQPPLHCSADSKQKRTKTVGKLLGKRILISIEKNEKIFNPQEAGQIAERCDKSMFELQHPSFRTTIYPGLVENAYSIHVDVPFTDIWD